MSKFVDRFTSRFTSRLTSHMSDPTNRKTARASAVMRVENERARLEEAGDKLGIGLRVNDYVKSAAKGDKKKEGNTIINLIIWQYTRCCIGAICLWVVYIATKDKISSPHCPDVVNSYYYLLHENGFNCYSVACTITYLVNIVQPCPEIKMSFIEHHTSAIIKVSLVCIIGYFGIQMSLEAALVAAIIPGDLIWSGMVSWLIHHKAKKIKPLVLENVSEEVWEKYYAGFFWTMWRAMISISVCTTAFFVFCTRILPKAFEKLNEQFSEPTLSNQVIISLGEMLITGALFSIFMPLTSRAMANKAQGICRYWRPCGIHSPCSWEDRASVCMNAIIESMRVIFGRGLLLKVKSFITFCVLLFKDESFNFFQFWLKSTECFLALRMKSLHFHEEAAEMSFIYQRMAYILEIFVRFGGVPKKLAKNWTVDVDYNMIEGIMNQGEIQVPEGGEKNMDKSLSEKVRKANEKLEKEKKEVEVAQKAADSDYAHLEEIEKLEYEEEMRKRQTTDVETCGIHGRETEKTLLEDDLGGADSQKVAGKVESSKLGNGEQDEEFRGANESTTKEDLSFLVANMCFRFVNFPARISNIGNFKRLSQMDAVPKQSIISRMSSVRQSAANAMKKKSSRFSLVDGQIIEAEELGEEGDAGVMERGLCCGLMNPREKSVAGMARVTSNMKKEVSSGLTRMTTSQGKPILSVKEQSKLIAVLSFIQCHIMIRYFTRACIKFFCGLLFFVVPFFGIHVLPTLRVYSSCEDIYAGHGSGGGLLGLIGRMVGAENWPSTEADAKYVGVAILFVGTDIITGILFYQFYKRQITTFHSGCKYLLKIISSPEFGPTVFYSFFSVVQIQSRAKFNRFQGETVVYQYNEAITLRRGGQLNDGSQAPWIGAFGGGVQPSIMADPNSPLEVLQTEWMQHFGPGEHPEYPNGQPLPFTNFKQIWAFCHGHLQALGEDNAFGWDAADVALSHVQRGVAP